MVFSLAGRNDVVLLVLVGEAKLSCVVFVGEVFNLGRTMYQVSEYVRTYKIDWGITNTCFIRFVSSHA